MGGQHTSHRGDNLALKGSIGQGVGQRGRLAEGGCVEHLGPQSIKARDPKG